jgi:hypothetical protein
LERRNVVNQRLDVVIARPPAVLPNGEPVKRTLALPDLPPADGIIAGVELLARAASDVAARLLGPVGVFADVLGGALDSVRPTAVALVRDFIKDKSLPFALVVPSHGGDDTVEVVYLKEDRQLEVGPALEWLALEMGVERDPALPARAGLRLDKAFLERPGAAELISFSMAKVDEWVGDQRVIAWAVGRAGAEPEGEDGYMCLTLDEAARTALATVPGGPVELLAWLMERAFARAVPLVARLVENERREDLLGQSVQMYDSKQAVGITIVVSKIHGAEHFEFQLGSGAAHLSFVAVREEDGWWKVTGGVEVD